MSFTPEYERLMANEPRPMPRDHGIDIHTQVLDDGDVVRMTCFHGHAFGEEFDVHVMYVLPVLDQAASDLTLCERAWERAEFKRIGREYHGVTHRCAPPSCAEHGSLHWVGFPFGAGADRVPQVWEWLICSERPQGFWHTPIDTSVTPEDAWAAEHRYLGPAICPHVPVYALELAS